MKIALLRTTSDHEGLKTFGSLSEIFSQFVAGVNINSFDVFPVHEGIFPADDYQADVYLISGSKHSVHDDLPWIHQLRSFIQDRLVKDTNEKFLGFCFGHQILANALGADVHKVANDNSQREWNVGIKPMTIQHQAAWMDPFHPEIELGFMHTEHAELPEGATLLAGTEDCANQMFEKDGRVLGIQSHPEYNPDRIIQAMNIVGIAKDYQEAALGKAADANDGSKILQQWIYRFIRNEPA